MMNLFQYLDFYIKNESNQTYADIINGNKNEDSIPNCLSGEEKLIYEQIRQSDRNRLLKYTNK